MQPQIYVGGEWIPAPRFCIGDTVVHAVDAANEPGVFWYDELDKRPRLFWWYRGIITGLSWDYGRGHGGKWWQPGWIYSIRISQCYEHGCAPEWNSQPIELTEDELKRSRYTARWMKERSQQARLFSLPAPETRMKEGVS